MYNSNQDKTIVGIDTVRKEILSRSKPSAIVFYALACIPFFNGIILSVVFLGELTRRKFDFSYADSLYSLLGVLESLIFFAIAGFVVFIVTRRQMRYKKGNIYVSEDVVDKKIIADRELYFKKIGKYTVKNWENHNLTYSEVSDEFYIVYLENRIVRIYNKNNFIWK